MPVNRSTGAPVDDLLGATMSSGQHPAGHGEADSRAQLPVQLRISDIGQTFTAASVQGLVEGSASGERPPGAAGSGAATRREPVPPISGVDQTAIGDPSQSAQPAIDMAAAEARGDPRQIQRFEVLRRLGAGGMGIVYAAYDWELERRLAIKVVRDVGNTSEAARNRIRREAQAMAKVSHPNVVQVYEVGEFNGQIYVAMEYVKGKSLSEWLQAEERTWPEILEVYVQAGRGLAAAHRQGVVHRDFKPENVLVDTDGRARVLDFGLARAEGGVPSDSETALIGHRLAAKGQNVNLTLAGAIMGTPAFMSPEQHLGQPADARSDQFSFCVALYAGLYNQAPFAGESLAELGISVTTGELRPPPDATHVPSWVFDALKIGLATNPADRYPSMDTLLAAVSPEAVAVPRRRWLWPVALVGASALAVVVTLTLVAADDPPGEDLETIARLEREAHEAAQRRRWVYPNRNDPRDTAYNRVVLLEHLDGPASEHGLSAAAGLRAEFAAQLVVLGDRFFDQADTRSYARDYYAQARVFMPDHRRASERAGVTLGQVAELTDRAGNGSFADAELIAAEPLRILADPDPVNAREDALALALDPERDDHEQSRLATLFRSSGILKDAEPRPKPEPAPETLIARVEPPPTPAPELPPETPPEPPPVTPPTKSGRKPARPAEVAVPSPAGPVVALVPEEDMSAKVDPDASRALVAEAEAARKRGDAATAEKLYNKALDLWNGNAAALIGLSDLAFERGNFDRAVKYAEKAVRVEPTSGEYQIRLGDAYFKVFRYSDAQQRYTRAADLGHPRAAERLARVQDKLGG